MTRDWPGDMRLGFWAHRFGGAPPLPYPEEATVKYGPRERCKLRPTVNVDVRNLVRKAHVTRLLWVDERDDGTIVVEPYCRKL